MKSTIVTLPVENINLSINYYKEYLGFQLIAKKHNSNAYLLFDNQKIKLEQINYPENKFKNNVVLYFDWNDSQMREHFSELRQKVKVKTFYSNNDNGVSVFSVIDCDGNVLNYQTKDAKIEN